MNGGALDEAVFSQAPDISIDHAVMEKTDKAAVVLATSTGAASAHGPRSAICSPATRAAINLMATSSPSTWTTATLTNPP